MSKTRWVARLLSVATLLFVLAFAFGGNEPLVMPQPREWLLLACFPIGLLTGLAVAWRNEVVGGAIGVGSVAMFYLLDFALSGTVPGGVFFGLLALPALLFLLVGVLAKRQSIAPPSV